MAEDKAEALPRPDLRAGVKLDELAESMPLLGQFDGEPVILVRQGDQLFATGAVCKHYGGPLTEGLVVGETIRCPWHHARFDLRTGEAERAPALNPVSCFNVLRHEGMVIVNGKKTPDFRVACKLNPSSVVIVGAGAAGAACADMLRAKGYARPVTLAGDEKPGPVDRPNLSKDFLAGTAGEDWIPLRTREYYESINVDLVTDDPAVRISPAEHQVSLRQRPDTQLRRTVAGDRGRASLTSHRRRGPTACLPAQNSRRQQSDHRQGTGSTKLCGDRLRFYRTGSGRVAPPSRARGVGHRAGLSSAEQDSGCGAGEIH